MEILKGLPRGVRGRDNNFIPAEFWADPQTIQQNFPYNRKQISPGAIGDQLIGLDTDQGLVSVAGAGSGKSVTLIGNAIYYQGSMLIIDPKSDIAEATAQWRDTAVKSDVYIFALGVKLKPQLQKYEATWNPFEMLTNPETLLEDIGLIADALIVHDPNAESHWSDSAKTFLEGVILHVATCDLYEGKRNLVTVHRLICNGKSMPDEDNPSIAGLVHEMSHHATRYLKDKDEELAEALEGWAFDFFERTGKERDSVLSTLRTNLKFLYYKAIRKMLVPHKGKKHLASLDMLKEKNITLYLSPTAGKLAIFNRALRLFVNLTLEAVERVKEKPKVPVLMVLDEFPVLGYMKQLDVAAGFIRGFGVKLWVIVQNLSQIKNLYEEGWETFLGNNCLQFFGNNDQFTLDYIENRCGQTPVQIVQNTIQKEEAVGSESISEEMHSLITAQEAARYFSRIDKLKRQLIIWPGHSPIILQRMEWFNPNTPYHQKYFSKFCHFLETNG